MLTVRALTQPMPATSWSFSTIFSNTSATYRRLLQPTANADVPVRSKSCTNFQERSCGHLGVVDAAETE